MSMVETPLFDLSDPRVQTIFDFWVTTMGKRSTTLLDHRRRARIEWALTHFTADEVREAIVGCSLSPFHMGINARGRKYNDLDLILRNAPKVDAFLEIFETETDGADDLEEWLNE
jgi:hypothetical protein